MHSIHATPSLSITDEVIPWKQRLATRKEGGIDAHSSRDAAAIYEWEVVDEILKGIAQSRL
jgi:hypothetical protein